MNKNKKIIILAIIVLFLLLIFLAVYQKNNSTTNKPVQSEEDKMMQELTIEPRELTEEERKELENTKTIRAVLKEADVKVVTVVPTGQETELNLLVPEEGLSIIKQTQEENQESLLNEEIGLFDLELEQEIEIQYNQETNEAKMIIFQE